MLIKVLMYTFGEGGKSSQKLYTFNSTQSDLQCYSIVYPASFSELKKSDAVGKIAYKVT